MFAKSLRELGVRPDTLVPICFEKSVWTIIVIVAILKAGGAFVPLGLLYPKERIEKIISETEGKVIISSPLQEGLSRDLPDQVLVVSASTLHGLPSTPQSRESCNGENYNRCRVHDLYLGQLLRYIV